MSNFTQSNVATPQSSCSSGSGTQTQANTLGPTSYKIAGVSVEFPAKAYPSQLAMMSKVILSLNKRQNCLLESPTGSGKSLALLCAALAWQRQEAARVEEYNGKIADRQHAAMVEQLRKEIEDQSKNVGGINQLDSNTKSCEGTEKGLWKEPPENMEIPSHESSLLTSDESMETTGCVDLVTDDEDDDDDFQPMKKVSLKSSSSSIGKENLPTPVRPVRSEGPRKKIEEEKDAVEEEYVPTPSEHKQTVPKIFFGTRTHKQISQITRELRKTHYKTSRSVVLASRQHTCIHPVVQKATNKNEACKELLDDQAHGGCLFQNNAKKFGNFHTLSDYVEPGFDLEDFVKAGRNARACPYFAARHLMLQADIIFCPYNYLIDPAIRKSMSIELENQIVIFDEAHNMEDAAREASSFVVSQDELQMAMQDLEKIGSTNGCFQPYAHQQLAKLMSLVSGWMDSKESSLKTLSFENSGKYWTGAELLAELEISGINADLVKMNLEYLQVILRHRDEEFENKKERGTERLPGGEKTPELQAMTVKTAESVFLIFESLNARGGIQMDDFRIALLKNTVRRSRDRHVPGFVSKEVLSLNVWCLNPAVAFHYLKDAVHSIVLTSGTLSPMQSFESELGVSFPIKLEASHVIDRSQVFASMLGIGPSNQKLNGSYRSVDTFQYQDELGDLVLRICQEMPRGVLVFFPSYRLLEKVKERWEITGCWRKINYCKRALIEPRSGASDFDHAIECFYEANASPIPPQTGGMFLAVCRGKVSEGIDFADNNARAVICVGIPFPAFKDMQVELKRNYNTDNRSRGLLSGHEWYEIQAFRALNQALGRCIRHRMDWGAIILVDERFILTPRYTQSLSKWVRNSVEGYKSWEPFMRKLVEFRENMSLRPVPEPSIETITIHDSSTESSFRSERDIMDSSSSFSSNSSSNNTPATNEPNWFAQSAFNGGRYHGNGGNVGSPRNRPVGNGQQQQRTPNAQSASPGNIKGTIPAMFLLQRAAKRQRDQSNW